MKKERISKGQWGYLKAEKKRRILRLLIFILIGIAIFFVGLLLNKFERTNIFTVIAILFVLPATREFIGYFVLAPYKTLNEERMQSVKALVQDLDLCYFDVAFTSVEKVMFAEAIVIGKNEICIWAEKKKDLIPYIESYLQKELKNRMFSYQLFVVSEEKKFVEKLRKMNHTEESNKEIKAYIESLMV